MMKNLKYLLGSMNSLRLIRIFFQKDKKIYLSYKFNIFLLFISFGIYLSILYFFSKLVNFNDFINQDTYFLYALIGIAIADFCLSISSGIRNEIMTSRSNGTFEELIIAPYNPLIIILLMFVFPVFMALFRLLFYLILIIIVSYYLVDISYTIKDFIIILFLIPISCLCYIGVGMISAAFVISFDRGDPIIYFNSAATFILSGVFYPTSVLWPVLEYVSKFIPIKHVIEISRSLAFDAVDYTTVNNGIMSLVLLSTIFIFIGLLACNLSINRAKKLGTFGNY